MNVGDPPFDPPYVTTIRTETGVSRFETLVDGTTRPVSRPAVDMTNSSPIHQPPSGSPGRAATGGNTATAAGSGARKFLNVPFAEKDEAKGMGARWDAARKKWYVPQDLDIKLFARWGADT